LDSERKVLEEEERLERLEREKRKKKKKRGRKDDEKKKTPEKKKEVKKETPKIKKKNIQARQTTGLLYDAMPNYVQLTLLRREKVSSPVTCLGTAYLYHRDFIPSPVKDTSLDNAMGKRDTISTSVELHGLDESRSLLLVTGHKNHQLVAWVFDTELNEAVDLLGQDFTSQSLLTKKKKKIYEENFRPTKAVIGTMDAEATSLQLGNILTSQWLAESSLSTTSVSKSTFVGHDKESRDRKESKSKSGEIERYKKKVSKKNY